MATNKHAVIRYQALDKCFSNFGRRFFIDDLIEACNNAIYEFSGISEGIKRRQLFEDIKFMESEAGYSIELDKQKEGKKTYYQYKDKKFSIKNQPLSQTEEEQLKATVMMLNRFKGLPQFDWMDEVLTRFEDTFKLKANVESVVSFEQNLDLRGLGHFTDLFNATINKQVLEINYAPGFSDTRKYILHPYHLKQYNNRWFLFGLNTTEGACQITNMSIDRIESFSVAHIPFVENKDIDFSEYFDDVVGVTVPNNVEIQTIILKIDKKRYNYIESKPLHQTQKVKERGDDYVVIELKLIPNYEFYTLLLGFADSVEITEPQSIRDMISERAKKIISKNICCADIVHNSM